MHTHTRTHINITSLLVYTSAILRRRERNKNISCINAFSFTFLLLWSCWGWGVTIRVAFLIRVTGDAPPHTDQGCNWQLQSYKMTGWKKKSSYWGSEEAEFQHIWNNNNNKTTYQILIITVTDKVSSLSLSILFSNSLSRVGAGEPRRVLTQMRKVEST